MASTDLGERDATLHGASAAARTLAAYASGQKDFREADLTNAVFGAAALSGIDFSRAVLVRSAFGHARLNDAVLTGTDVRESDLSDAELEGISAEGACMRGARLTRARLVRANLKGADLAGADLDGSDLSGADLTEADLSGASLCGARLEGVNLQKANLSGAKLLGALLVRSDLGAANLRDAVFRGAEVSSCQLMDSDCIGADFGMSNLKGSRLPEDFHGFTSWLDNIDALAKQGRTVFSALVGLCAYVLVSVATTSDIELVMNNARLQLPLLQAPLPIQLFYLGASLSVLCLFGYLQIYLLQQARLMTRLPQVFPNGIQMADRVSPWTLSAVLASWMRRPHQLGGAGRERYPFSLGALAAVAIAWGLAPFTAGVLLVRFLTSQNETVALALWGLFLAITLISITSHRIIRSLCGRRFGRIERVALAGALFLVMLLSTPGVLRATGAFRTVAKYQDISTQQGSGEWRGANLEEVSLVAADLSGAGLNNAVLRGAHLKGAHLLGARLGGADLTAAFLEAADLSGAALPDAYLIGARARGLILNNVDARGAHLYHARLEGSKAKSARFDDGDLRGVRLDSANLTAAVFAEADLAGANLEGADLQSASFRGAILRRANLDSTRLGGTRFEGADLTFATLVGAMDLTAQQLCSAKNWRSALLPGDEVPTRKVPFEIRAAGPLRLSAERACGSANDSP